MHRMWLCGVSSFDASLSRVGLKTCQSDSDKQHLNVADDF